ncbi:amidohydrolase family protein [Solirubrobacter soli]|uniref:amidohydrolase family protein n=1 Tax=Solirubrobacter soli TaxID=363832 RepID=UPI000402D4D5|nr:amidohydrolase family protein [Solirubrobacter soli]
MPVAPLSSPLVPTTAAKPFVLPALADPHVHLDKALTVDQVANPAGDLAGAIDAWLGFRATQSADAIRERARRAALTLLRNGTTAIRAHVDTGPDIGLRAVHALLGLREELEGVLDLQVVACAFLPLTGRGSADVKALAAEALAAGADLLGGAPWLDADPAGAYDAVVELAHTAGVGLDLHVDETLDPRVFTLPALLDRVEGGFPHPVAVDHLVSLPLQDDPVRARTAERLATAGVGVVALPATNLYLQGREAGALASRGLTAVRELLDAGVTVAAGGDNVRDPFNPTGRLDPLETAGLLVTAAHLSLDEALAAVSDSARALMGLAPSTDSVTLPASSLADAIAAAPVDRVVERDGRVVARTTVRVEA